jgi:hypothetical protein
MMEGAAFALDLSADDRKLEISEAGEYQDACNITIGPSQVSPHQSAPTNANNTQNFGLAV